MRVQADNLCFRYRSTAGSHEVFQNLSFAVEDGEFLALIGPSGSGKSTLLHILAGLLLPDAGTVLLDGRPLCGPGLERSIVFQEYALFPWIRALENVSFCIRQADRHLSRREANALAQKSLENVGLSDRADAYPSQLSGGQRQRVAIARALAMNSRLLLFDEPFGAVDPQTRQHLQMLFETVWRAQSPQKSVVFVTHDIDEALLLADRLLFLDRGGVRDSFSVPLPRPRSREMLLSGQACSLRRRCMRLYQESVVSGL